MKNIFIFLLLLASSALVSAESFNGIDLPNRLAEFRYIQATDYEKTNKGLGYGIEYSSPGVKGTIYIYNLGKKIPEGANSAEVSSTFKQSFEDIKKLYQNVQIEEGPHKVSFGGREFLAVRIKMVQAGRPLVSYLYVTGAMGSFIKTRLTYSDDGHDALGRSMQNAFMIDLAKAL